MKVFYHSADNDGKCSGHLIYDYEHNYRNNEIECIGINYGQEFPFHSISTQERIYIVDYSISPDEMRQLLGITSQIIWIDHHKTAIEKYNDFEYGLAGIRYDGIAASMLTWCYIQESKYYTGDWKKWIENAPTYVKYIADYDVWTFEYGDITKNFQKGTYLLDLEPTSDVWDNLDLNMDKIIESGALLIEYSDKINANLCKYKGFEANLLGYSCYVLNKSGCGSDTFKSIDQDKYQVYIGFCYDGKIWTHSLRSGLGEASKDIDVSEIAKKFGGGGHKHAAGFETKECIF